MASYVPQGEAGGSAGNQQPEPAEPVPGWRKLIAFVGWGVPIAVLIVLNFWGVLQLVQGPPTSASVTTDTDTPTIESPSPGALPPLPSVITLPSLQGLPTEIALPPG